jgi:hypothetical protein
MSTRIAVLCSEDPASSPDKRANRKGEVLVRQMSGKATYQELASISLRGAYPAKKCVQSNIDTSPLVQFLWETRLRTI